MKLNASKVEDWAAALRRELLKELNDAIEMLSSRKNRLSEEQVHETRKSLKKVGAGLRLLRGFKNLRAVASKANTVLRDAGRPLSSVRDSEVLVSTAEDLLQHFGKRVQRGSGERLGRVLAAHRAAVRKEVFESEHARATVLKAVRSGRRAIAQCQPPSAGPKDLADAFLRLFRKARDAFAAASGVPESPGQDDPFEESLHEARKRAKDLRYVLELFAEIYPFLQPTAKAAHALTDILGLEHDLGVLRSQLAGDTATSLDLAEIELFTALIDERRAALRREAKTIAIPLYAEKPRAFAQRFRAAQKALSRLPA